MRARIRFVGIVMMVVMVWQVIALASMMLTDKKAEVVQTMAVVDEYEEYMVIEEEKATAPPVIIQVEEAEEVMAIEEVAEVAEVVYFDLPIKEEYQDILFAKCEELEIMPEVIASMIIQESNGREDAVGDGGRSFGLMQIQPRWWQWLAEEIGADIKEPEGNIETGVHIVAYLLEKYDGDMGRALTAYNSGSGNYVGEYAIEVLNRIDGIEYTSFN